MVIIVYITNEEAGFHLLAQHFISIVVVHARKHIQAKARGNNVLLCGSQTIKWSVDIRRVVSPENIFVLVVSDNTLRKLGHDTFFRIFCAQIRKVVTSDGWLITKGSDNTLFLCGR